MAKLGASRHARVVGHALITFRKFAINSGLFCGKRPMQIRTQTHTDTDIDKEEHAHTHTHKGTCIANIRTDTHTDGQTHTLTHTESRYYDALPGELVCKPSK